MGDTDGRLLELAKQKSLVRTTKGGKPRVGTLVFVRGNQARLKIGESFVRCRTSEIELIEA